MTDLTLRLHRTLTPTGRKASTDRKSSTDRKVKRGSAGYCPVGASPGSRSYAR